VLQRHRQRQPAPGAHPKRRGRADARGAAGQAIRSQALGSRGTRVLAVDPVAHAAQEREVTQALDRWVAGHPGIVADPGRDARQP